MISSRTLSSRPLNLSSPTSVRLGVTKTLVPRLAYPFPLQPLTHSSKRVRNWLKTRHFDFLCFHTLRHSLQLIPTQLLCVQPFAHSLGKTWGVGVVLVSLTKVFLIRLPLSTPSLTRNTVRAIRTGGTRWAGAARPDWQAGSQRRGQLNRKPRRQQRPRGRRSARADFPAGGAE